MKILLIAGHGAGDTGACGCGYQEYKLTRELVDLIAPRLRRYATVDVYDKNRSAFYDCQNGAFRIGSYDYVLEVHFNACVNDQRGDGHTTGTEIYVTSSEKATTVEQSIINKVAACGLKNRGVKVTDFLVIRTVKNKGISSALIETCFIDDKDDMDVYQGKKTAIADAIVNGIAEGFGLKATASQPKPETPSKPAEKPASQSKYKTGDVVNISGVYASSSSTQKLTPLVKSGKITKVLIGARNPYLLNDGNIGWVNDGCITTKGTASNAAKKSVNEVANEIMNKPNYGGWGTGQTRKNKLTVYGGSKFASDVQNRINQLCK